MFIIRYGFCSRPDFMKGDENSRKIFDAIAQAGFDYLETQLSLIAALDKSDYERFKKELAAAGLPVRAGLLLFANELALVTDDMDINAITAHADRVLGIANDLGAELVVFGSGGTRKVKDGMDRGAVYKRMQQIIESCDPIAGKHGVKIALEPLCFKETNMINSVGEAADLINSVKTSNTGAVCDWYHVRMNNMSLKDVLAYRDMVVHLHIAYPDGRKMPTSADDLSEYADFVKVVKEIGYNDKISVEGNAGEVAVERFRDSLATLKKLFD